MTKRTSNHYRAWTPGELKQLRAFAKARMPTKVIARRLKRTLFAVYSKVEREAIVLAPALKRRAPGQRGAVDKRGALLKRGQRK